MQAVTLAFAFAFAASVQAQAPRFSPEVRQFIAVDTAVVVIRSVRVIDGTGAAAREGQSIVIRDGKIAAIVDGTIPNSRFPLPRGAQVIEGVGKTVIPGLVLVHEHLFYPTGERATYMPQPYTFPRLYLGAGITTARTGGNLGAYTDLNVKRWIDAGAIPGPKLDVTAPYLTGENPFPQVYALKDSADARRFVSYWADLGATSFKAYMQITREQLRAAVDEAHRRGLKVTGHLCSVTYREAAEIGIDNIEHGFIAATDFVPGKRPDVCPAGLHPILAQLNPETDTVARSVIETLVNRKVALTSTLAIFETFAHGRPATPQRILDAMTPAARLRYLENRAETAVRRGPWERVLDVGMRLEKMFADAGGLLVAGTDPTGYGGVIPGYSSQRTIELLVEAGFTPVEAIRIATLNGATYLGRANRVGTIAVGKDADLLLIAGDPSARIADIQKVELVFKDGVGYDSAKLLSSAKGMVGGQ